MQAKARQHPALPLSGLTHRAYLNSLSHVEYLKGAKEAPRAAQLPAGQEMAVLGMVHDEKDEAVVVTAAVVKLMHVVKLEANSLSRDFEVEVVEAGEHEVFWPWSEDKVQVEREQVLSVPFESLFFKGAKAESVATLKALLLPCDF